MHITEYLEKVENGARPSVSFKERKFKLNGQEVEVNGDNVDDAYAEIEKLYANFKRSYPSENSELYHDKFKALKAEELTDYDLVMGEERTLARAKLEAYFLCWVLNGSLKWKDETKFFWQSQNDEDLVILKEWVIV